MRRYGEPGLDVDATMQQADGRRRMHGRWPLVGRDEELARAVASLDRHGAVLVGAAGTGKTRLAAELARSALAEGRTCLRVVASSATSDIALGALLPLLDAPDVRASSERDQLHAVAKQLIGAADSAEVVLFVDDAQHLDALSATVIVQLVMATEARVVLTVRSGEPCPAPITNLWASDACERIELAALTRPEVARMLEAALGAPIDLPSLQRIMDCTSGNPLHVREVVLAAADAGELRLDDGRWRVDELPLRAGRLVALVESRLASVTAAQRSLLELVALAEGEGLALFHGLVDDDDPSTVLAELELQGLLLVEASDRRRRAFLAHPIHGEVLRASIPVARRHELLRELAARIDALGARRREDPVTLARWRLEVGDESNAPDVLRAARLAHYQRDDDLAARLARSVLAVEDLPEARWILAAACEAQGRREESEELLGGVDLDRCDGPLTLLVVHRRAENLFWGLGQHERASAVAEEGLAVVERPEDRDQLLSSLASFDLLSGHPSRAAERVTHIAERGDGRETVAAALITAPSLALLGRTREALAIAEQGIATRLAHAADRDLSELGMLVVAQCFALVEDGQLGAAAEAAEGGYDLALAEGVTVGQAWFALMAARAHLFAGRARQGDRWFAEAGARYADLGLAGCVRWCVGGRLWCAAMLGERADADALRAEFDRTPPRAVTMMEPELARALAAADVLAGAPAGASARLEDAAAIARSRQQWTLEAGALHDLTRLGDATSATAARLAELADQTDSQAITLRARWARAAVDRDGDELERVADTCAALGAHLDAAEATGQAADAARRGGDGSAERRRARIAEERFAECDVARTASLPPPKALVPLTRREREIALMAAEGASVRQIAERLTISMRTVENHLHRAYVKLGISGKRELPEVLGGSMGSGA